MNEHLEIKTMEDLRERARARSLLAIYDKATAEGKELHIVDPAKPRKVVQILLPE